MNSFYTSVKTFLVVLFKNHYLYICVFSVVIIHHLGYNEKNNFLLVLLPASSQLQFFAGCKKDASKDIVQENSEFLDKKPSM